LETMKGTTKFPPALDPGDRGGDAARDHVELVDGRAEDAHDERDPNGPAEGRGRAVRRRGRAGSYWSGSLALMVVRQVDALKQRRADGTVLAAAVPAGRRPSSHPRRSRWRARSRTACGRPTTEGRRGGRRGAAPAGVDAGLDPCAGPRLRQRPAQPREDAGAVGPQELEGDHVRFQSRKAVSSRSRASGGASSGSIRPTVSTVVRI
jgi:hypothetical protein